MMVELSKERRTPQQHTGADIDNGSLELQECHLLNPTFVE
jgi:hypothetical protein